MDQNPQKLLAEQADGKVKDRGGGGGAGGTGILSWFNLYHFKCPYPSLNVQLLLDSALTLVQRLGKVVHLTGIANL